MTLKLPKCGNVRNILENYDIEKSKHEEEKLIKILLTPRYQRQKECKLLREANHEIILDKEALEKLLKCHPFPRYQGPFYKPMTCRIYEEFTQDEDNYTFESYTTFQHTESQSCKIWKIINKNDDDKLKLHLTFNTNITKTDQNLAGPASDRHMSIMYNCQKHRCVIMCPCAVCDLQTSSCRLVCRSNPCNECSAQCTEHNIDLPRKYDKEVDSFTIPCYSQAFKPTQVDPEYALSYNGHGHSQYAGIPRSCDKCRLNLLDHQIHHHVLHDRCKFCKVVLRVIDKENSVEIWEKEKKIKQNDDKTCGSCYKVFTRIQKRKLHEKLEHGYYDVTIGRKRQYIVHGIENDWEKKRHQCENCNKSYASKVALKYHELRFHSKKLLEYECEICIKKFLSETTLKRHIESIHQSNCEQKCEICAAKFKRKDMLTSHCREVHHEANINHHYYLNSSLPAKDAYPYSCDVCGDRFKRKANAKRHKKLVHDTQKEASKSNTHNKSEHVQINRNEEGPSDEIDKTLCQICNKSFSAVKNLNRHIKLVHHGAKTNCCDSCELSFVRKEDLEGHNNNVHKGTSATKVECEKCKKQFGRRDNMLKHMKYCYEKN